MMTLSFLWCRSVVGMWYYTFPNSITAIASAAITTTTLLLLLLLPYYPTTTTTTTLLLLLLLLLPLSVSLMRLFCGKQLCLCYLLWSNIMGAIVSPPFLWFEEVRNSDLSGGTSGCFWVGVLDCEVGYCGDASSLRNQSWIVLNLISLRMGLGVIIDPPRLWFQCGYICTNDMCVDLTQLWLHFWEFHPLGSCKGYGFSIGCCSL